MKCNALFYFINNYKFVRYALLKYLTSWFCLKLWWRGQARDRLIDGARDVIDRLSRNNPPPPTTSPSERVYDPKPAQPGGKHGPGGRGTRMDLDPETAQKVLREGIQGGGKKQVYGYQNGKIYEFQPDNAGQYHGYPLQGNQVPRSVPSSVLREFRDSGIITKPEYNKFVNGK